MNEDQNKFKFLDFFAGSGLVSEGLKNWFSPVWANDICEKKRAVFCANHPEGIFQLGPIEKIQGSDLPYGVLSWGSFPCQDLSLAGNLKGLESKRSGLVWQWLRVMDEMQKKPPLVIAENVVGLISASNGMHYRALHKALVRRGYKVGAFVIDASYWVPQSRKRVFVLGVDKKMPTEKYETDGPIWCHPHSVVRASSGLYDWIWWKLPRPLKKNMSLSDVTDFAAPCFEKEKSEKLLALIPPRHRKIIDELKFDHPVVFPGYKRIRKGNQVLELRFDGLAGCLRTPSGGSSRQFLVIKDNGTFCTRLLTVSETAALMGVRKGYKIPGTYNDAYKAMGDAVAVPVTYYLGRQLLYPLAQIASKEADDEDE